MANPEASPSIVLESALADAETFHTGSAVELREAILQAAARHVALPDFRVRRALRVAAGLRQDELAAVLGVTRPSVSRWESGTREPRGELRRRYADVLKRLDALRSESAR
jgi:DNA-binding transcriptional regulator YiaG